MVHILQSDPEVPPGLAAEELDRLSVEWRLVRLGRGEPLPPVRDDDAVIVLGGRMSANDEEHSPFLRQVKGLLRESVDRGIRCLGICLGGQLLAAAFGAAVVEKRWGERGNCQALLNPAGCDDPLFRGVQPLFPAFQWHNDSFDLPEGAVLLALSERCPHQAFRLVKRGWGVQFHPEVTPAIMQTWAADGGADELVAGWKRLENAYRGVLEKMLLNFLS